MYLGAVCVFDQSSNPDRIPQAAHSLRELVDALFGGPVAEGPGLHGEVIDLRAKWPGDRMLTQYQDQADLLMLDDEIRGFLEAINDFFTRFDDRPRSRREQVMRLVRARGLSTGRYVARWLGMRRQFLAVAHHGKSVTDAQFRQLLDDCDSLVIELLRPKMFDQLDEIDRIIAEAEGQT